MNRLRHDPHQMVSDGLTQKRGNRIADLHILLRTRPEKLEPIRKSLKASGFPNGDGPVLFRVDIGSPMNVALGQDRAGKAVPRHTSITLGVIRSLGPLHSGGKKIIWNVAPASAWRDMREAINIYLPKFWGRMIGYRRCVAAHLALISAGLVIKIRDAPAVLPVGNRGQVTDSVFDLGEGFKARTMRW
jgi:hypothetical protein